MEIQDTLYYETSSISCSSKWSSLKTKIRHKHLKKTPTDCLTLPDRVQRCLHGCRFLQERPSFLCIASDLCYIAGRGEFWSPRSGWSDKASWPLKKVTHQNPVKLSLSPPTGVVETLNSISHVVASLRWIAFLFSSDWINVSVKSLNGNHQQAVNQDTQINRMI